MNLHPRWLVAGLLLVGACERDVGRPNREYFPDMASSVPYDSFAPNPNSADGRTMRPPVAGTIPRGHQPLAYAAGPEEAARAARELANPFSEADAVLARGKVAFERYCSHCHGKEGLGDGLVARRFPRPPSLTAAHARDLADGQIFHIITFGQGVMPAHRQQVTERDRWMIVHHIRKLQGGKLAQALPRSDEPSPKRSLETP